MNQNHLNYLDRINFGSYYTSNQFTNIVWEMIQKHISNNTVILDSSCGYGNFFDKNSKNIQIGNDIDEKAIEIAKKNHPNLTFFNQNALQNVSRKNFGIKENQKLCIIGNPPYNDTTSIIRSDIKKLSFEIDEDIKTRDLGMSFMLSYEKLNADFVCILHPLSYLIKKSNFGLLKNFTKKYSLKENLIINSGVFSQASKSTQFPIIIGLYEKNDFGMKYEDIENYDFMTIDGKVFKLKNFEYIDKYISKYPSKFAKDIKENDILFWTMRDINALKRNRTFVNSPSENTIIINKNKLDYYVYVDVFKQFTEKIPYYFGNLSVFIDNDLFLEYKKYFLINSISRNNFLEKEYSIKIDENSLNYANEKLKEYFLKLLNNHYVYK